MHCVSGDEPEQSDEYFLHNLGSSSESPPVKVNVMVDNQPMCMEIDTGVGPSLVSEATFNELFPDRPLSPASVRLRTYSGEPTTVLGSIEADVQYKAQKSTVTPVGSKVPRAYPLRSKLVATFPARLV